MGKIHLKTVKTLTILLPLTLLNIITLQYVGIEKVSLLRRGGEMDKILLKREAFWIQSLKTLTPFGLKIDFDLKTFL